MGCTHSRVVLVERNIWNQVAQRMDGVESFKELVLEVGCTFTMLLWRLWKSSSFPWRFAKFQAASWRCHSFPWSSFSFRLKLLNGGDNDYKNG